MSEHTCTVHKPGSAACYNSRHRCRCTPCRKAASKRRKLYHLHPQPAIDATGTRRRLQALIAVGWSMSAIAERSGYRDRANLHSIMRAKTVKRDTAERIAAVYDHLWDQPPPEHRPHQRAAASRSRRIAEQNGWPPPMAWDDEQIDDPSARPHRPRRTSTKASLEDVEWLAMAGGTVDSVAARIYPNSPDSRSSLYQLIHRHGRHDLWLLMGGESRKDADPDEDELAA